MVRTIVRDPLLLARVSEPATKADGQIADDLMDTLRFHLDRCVGMAANMIGENKRIIVFSNGFALNTMINPVITEKDGAYETEEGCLSLIGVRKTKRYRRIRVEYLDRSFVKRKGTFEGYTAQIIQHEIDHCDGILI